MLSVNQFNGLGGTTATRESLIEIRNQAINDGNEEIITRIDGLLASYPEGEIFKIELISPVEEVPGLGAAQHTGIEKEALNSCGRLNPGYRYISKGVIEKSVPRKAKVKEVIEKISKGDVKDLVEKVVESEADKKSRENFEKRLLNKIKKSKIQVEKAEKTSTKEVEKKPVSKTKATTKKTPEQLKKIAEYAKALAIKKQAIKEKFAKAGAKTSAERRKGNVPEKDKELGQLLSEYTIISNRISRFKTKKSIAETKTFDQLNERSDKIVQEVSLAIDGKYSEALEYIDEWIQKKNNVFVFDEKKYVEAALQAYGKTKTTPAKKPVSNGQKKTKETAKKPISKTKTAIKPAVKPVANVQKKTKEKLENNSKGFAIKPKSSSIQTAIKDVLGLPKFKGVKELPASLLFKNFKDEPYLLEPKELFLSEYENAILSKETKLHEYYEFQSLQELTLTSLGEDFILAVRGRLESLRNQKNNYALFDGLKVPITGNIEDAFSPEVEKIVSDPADQEPIAPKETPIVKNKLMQMQFESLPMDEGWENFMQNPAKNMKIAIWGPPKNGKTAGALQLASYLTKFGKVLYDFVDQGFNLSTQELWKNSGLASNPNAEPSDIQTLDALEKEIAAGKYTFVFIDMISDFIRKEKITPDEFKTRFIKGYPNVSFILIFEVTKGGNFKGDQGWTHVVDAIVTVEDFLMENRGRYGMGYHIVWEDGLKRFNPKRFEEVKEFLEPEEEISFTEEVERI